MKLEYTLPWHFYKKETTILFPFPQIFETSCSSTPVTKTRQLDLLMATKLLFLILSMSIRWLATPPSVRDCLHAGPNIDTSRVPAPHNTTHTTLLILQHQTPLYIQFHNTTLIEETNNRPTPHSVHRCLHHTVKSTGPILISAGSPPTFLGTSQEKKISKHCWTVNVSWLGYHRESAITQCHQPMRHAAALKNCLKFVMASKVFR